MASKSKGGGFEREVAVLLSKWWTEGKRDDVFWRSQASGGRFTVRRKTGKDTVMQGGDITASDPIGEPLMKKWSIEIKTGYGKKTDTGVIRWDLLDFMDSRQKAPILQKMWEQCYRDAELTLRQPILIFRRNGRTPCIMFTIEYFDFLKSYFGGYYGDYVQVSADVFVCMIMPLNNFFEYIPDIRCAI